MVFVVGRGEGRSGERRAVCCVNGSGQRAVRRRKRRNRKKKKRRRWQKNKSREGAVGEGERKGDVENKEGNEEGN